MSLESILSADPKFPKPGAKQKKTKVTKTVKVRNIHTPELTHCRKCMTEDGTECYRHIETFRKFSGGKGVGAKTKDTLTAWLCQKCDNIMSTKPHRLDELKVAMHAEEWNFLIIKTWLL